MKWWWNNDEMMMKYLNVNLSALSTHANHATPCVTSKLRSHPPHLWDLLLPARSPPALLKLRHLWSGQKWCSCNSSPSLFIIESVLSIFIRFIWIFKLLSINKNHAQLLPDAGDRASGRTSTWKACVFSNSRLKPSSLRVLFKPLWIDASGVLPSFQSCFSASFTSSFLTAVALKKTYEYLLVPFQGANSADFQFINSKLLLHSVTSIDWRFLEFCFNETVQFCMAFHVEIHFFQGNPTPITYSNSPCLHQAFAALRSAAFRAVSSANRWVALGNDSNNWAKLPQRESAK